MISAISTTYTDKDIPFESEPTIVFNINPLNPSRYLNFSNLNLSIEGPTLVGFPDATINGCGNNSPK